MTGDNTVLTWIGTPKNKQLKIVLTSSTFEAPINIVSFNIVKEGPTPPSVPESPGQDTLGTKPIYLVTAKTGTVFIPRPARAAGGTNV